MDNIRAEQLKYGCSLINEGIATLLNSISKIGNYPKEIKKVSLYPYLNQGRKKALQETSDQSYF